MHHGSLLVNINEACGLIQSDLATVFRSLNSLRNKYAHKLSFGASEAEVKAYLTALKNMENPFYISDVQSTKHELCRGLAAISGWLEREFGKVI